MLDWLLDERFMPHGHCFLWSPEVLWVHVVSDALIAFAYGCIPIALVVFVRRRTDLAFKWMFVLFGAFIVCCGLTHLTALITIWEPIYRFEGVLKTITAGISLATAVLLVPLLPRALSLPSPRDLRQAKQDLEAEVVERRAAEARVRVLNAELEERVAERTTALETRNAELARLARVMSHDLREPARTMTNFTRLLLERHGDTFSAEATEFAEIAADGARRLQQMLTELARSAQLEELELEEVDLQALVDNVVSDLAAQLDDRGARVDVGKLGASVVHRTSAYQILTNLISNATKYGGPRPHIELGKRDDGAHIELYVRDHGPGIPAGAEERIFDMFERLPRDAKEEGSGMGLATARRLAERMGCQLTFATPKTGHGALFSLRMQRSKHGEK